MSGRANRTIYVGNLPLDIRESEVEDLFYKYGRIMEIELKNPPRPPGFCFVEFESSQDADDAIRGRDGYNFDGYRLRVELAHGGRGQSSSFGRGSSYKSGGSNKYGIPRRSEYRVVVRGLPSKASWQDLKDHMRKAGDVCFAQVFRNGDGSMGLVDYTNYEDMKYAIRKLDDTEFRNPFGRSYIRVCFFSKKNIQDLVYTPNWLLIGLHRLKCTREARLGVEAGVGVTAEAEVQEGVGANPWISLLLLGQDPHLLPYPDQGLIKGPTSQDRCGLREEVPCSGSNLLCAT